MSIFNNTRSDREIAHGKMMASVGDVEQIWGWGSPAGQMRARRRAQIIADGAHLNSGVKVLEIGCGTGLFTEMFARTGAQIVAVDISPNLLKLARERGLPADRVSFVEAPFEDCGIEGPFDAIIGSSVLHHLDVEVALKKIYSLLKPGGVISFAEPNMLNPQVFIERKLSFVRPLFSYVSPDETAFVRWKLRKLLLNCGFEDVMIKPFDWLHPLTPKPLIGFVSRLGSCLEKLPILKEFSGSLCIRACRPL